MDFSRVELSDDDQALPRRGARLPRATQVTDEVIAPRPRDRRQLRRGRASGAAAPRATWRRMEAGVRRRLQPGAAPHLGAGEATRARAVGDVGHHRHGGAVGGAVRLTGTAGRGDAAGVSAGTSGCAWATPSPRAAPTSPPARPARCARRMDQLDHQRLQDVHHRRAQLPVRLPDHQHRSRRAESTRA